MLRQLVSALIVMEQSKLDTNIIKNGGVGMTDEEKSDVGCAIGCLMIFFGTIAFVIVIAIITLINRMI